MTKTPQTPQPFWFYCINFEAIDAAAARATKAGGKICHGPLEAPGGQWIVQCLDPQGAMFALQRSAMAAGVRAGLRQPRSAAIAEAEALQGQGLLLVRDLQFGEPRCHLITVAGLTTIKSSRRTR
jgi:hypothetical protein